MSFLARASSNAVAARPGNWYGWRILALGVLLLPIPAPFRFAWAMARAVLSSAIIGARCASCCSESPERRESQHENSCYEALYRFARRFDQCLQDPAAAKGPSPPRAKMVSIFGQ